MAEPSRKKKGRKLKLGKLYSFVGGGRRRVDDAERERLELGGPGFSRVVYANEPINPEVTAKGYRSNTISTTKYTPVTFIPKSLFEQFRRVANLYFLLTGCLAYTPLAPYSGGSAVLPLVLVIAATMAKEAIEDLRRRKQDTAVNNRKVKVRMPDGSFQHTQWMNLRVGDMVKIDKDEYFPADLILLSSSFEDGTCYVETMNLDGETNLKLKQSLDVTSKLDDESLQDFHAVIHCEDPNAHLYTFVGNIQIENQEYSLSPQQLLLRDSKLRNTECIYGVVIFTGHDTKVMQNSMQPPSKRSKIERKMDQIIYLLLLMLVTIALTGSIVFGINTGNEIEGGNLKTWYLRPDDSNIYFDPNKPAISAILHFFTAMMLYSYFIPISLYVSIEIVKILQALFINSDIHMYYDESDEPARCRTSNLSEELGQVDTILSDKTGTLTCNSMEFIKCSIAGTAYGRGVTEVERAMAKRKGEVSITEDQHDVSERPSEHRKHVQGFNFADERISRGKWIDEPHHKEIEKFFRLLAVCHTCIPDVDEESGQVTYEAESPDEAAFVVAARELGFEFYQRTQTTVSLHEFNPESRNVVDRSYKLLNVLEFNSTRKRMSVIVRDENGKITLFSKGADNVMFERLADEGRAHEEVTKKHINEYADAGLRTLILAYREVEEDEYAEFDKKFTAAKNSVSADRDEKVEEVANSMERDLFLLGATAVEDKLQKGVPECIDKLAQAGIKLWVLTGDKMETAINIGYACSLLRQGMKQIVITLDTPEIIALERSGDKEGAAKQSKVSVMHQISEGKRLMNAQPGETYALIIDGKSLTYALHADTKDIFLDLALSCGSVICCRSSPKQKALVTRLVKSGTGNVTLAIGDGANDVGMIQEADIGIGISGAEGMQAVMASDVSIAQFRFLERLLLVHGHWCYRRITSMVCYFFYKNLIFGITLFLYEAYTGFSGQALYEDWSMSFYNVFFTSMPVIALGVLDQDVSPRFCLKYPVLYQEGPQNLLFKWRRIIGWMAYGATNGVMVFFLTAAALQYQAFRDGGEVIDKSTLSTTIYTSVVWVATLQMVLFVQYFTFIQHFFIWGSVAVWYLFMLIFGSFPPQYSTTVFMVFSEGLAPSKSYWLVTLFVTLTTLIPYFCYSSIQVQYFPSYHDVIQHWRHLEKRLGSQQEVDSLLRSLSKRKPKFGLSVRRDAQRGTARGASPV